MVSGKDPLKEIIMTELENIAYHVQLMDQVYIPEVYQNRSKYTNEDVFSNVLIVLQVATTGIGLINLLHKYCHLTQEDMDYTEELMRGYNHLQHDLLAIYREHSKNTEELH